MAPDPLQIIRSMSALSGSPKSSQRQGTGIAVASSDAIGTIISYDGSRSWNQREVAMTRSPRPVTATSSRR